MRAANPVPQEAQMRYNGSMGELKKARVAILIGTHGRGSNMAALAKGCAAGAAPAEVAVVVAPNDTAPAVEVARGMGLEVAVIPYKAEDYASALMKELTARRCDYVCLAGFMRLLPEEVLAAFPNRVLNIHPALLPKFGGKGMYGMHVHEAVIASGDKESGCSVHYVNERYDEGAVILQLRCPVEPGDTPETLASRVLALEHRAYASALAKVIDAGG
jgi:phosphoribosylglycinamide formyltransferase-1